MRIDDLNRVLQEKGIRSSWYCIGAERDNALCVTYEDQRWQVFFSERGHRFDLVAFESEEDAAAHFYRSLLESTKYV